MQQRPKIRLVLRRSRSWNVAGRQVVENAADLLNLLICLLSLGLLRNVIRFVWQSDATEGRRVFKAKANERLLNADPFPRR